MARSRNAEFERDVRHTIEQAMLALADELTWIGVQGHQAVLLGRSTDVYLRAGEVDALRRKVMDAHTVATRQEPGADQDDD